MLWPVNEIDSQSELGCHLPRVSSLRVAIGLYQQRFFEVR